MSKSGKTSGSGTWIPGEVSALNAALAACRTAQAFPRRLLHALGLGVQPTCMRSKCPVCVALWCSGGPDSHRAYPGGFCVAL